jgi:two-component system, NarL family, nitrate/nitrite response regulator NarL
MIKLLILDEQKIFRDGIIFNFQNEKDIQVLEIKSNEHHELEKLFDTSPAQLIKKISSLQPDVILIDAFYNNRNRLPFIKNLLKKLPHLKIVILSNKKENIYLFEARILGVKAFLLKTDPFSEILKCVISAANGSNEYHIKMMKDVENKPQTELPQTELPQTELPQTKLLLLKSLNSTENDVLKLLAQGKKVFEIALISNISERTVYRIKKSMMYNLDIECDSDLFRFFF